MSDILDRAKAIIDNAAELPDPEGDLEQLEAEAPEYDRHMFSGLWEALALKLADVPEEA